MNLRNMSKNRREKNAELRSIFFKVNLETLRLTKSPLGITSLGNKEYTKT